MRWALGAMGMMSRVRSRGVLRSLQEPFLPKLWEHRGFSWGESMQCKSCKFMFPLEIPLEDPTVRLNLAGDLHDASLGPGDSPTALLDRYSSDTYGAKASSFQRRLSSSMITQVGSKPKAMPNRATR